MRTAVAFGLLLFLAAIPLHASVPEWVTAASVTAVPPAFAGDAKAVVVFDMTKSAPDDDTLADAILGPTGNLKAPTLRIGDTLVVGFNEEAYRQVFG